MKVLVSRIAPLLALGLLSFAALADERPAPANPGVKPSQMVALVAANPATPCAFGGYALDLKVDPGTASRSPFSVPAGQALVVTNVTTNGGGYLTLQSATDSALALYVSYAVNVSDMVVKPGVTICVSASLGVVGAFNVHGHLVKDN